LRYFSQRPRKHQVQTYLLKKGQLLDALVYLTASKTASSGVCVVCFHSLATQPTVSEGRYRVKKNSWRIKANSSCNPSSRCSLSMCCIDDTCPIPAIGSLLLIVLIFILANSPMRPARFTSTVRPSLRPAVRNLPAMEFSSRRVLRRHDAPPCCCAPKPPGQAVSHWAIQPPKPLPQPMLDLEARVRIDHQGLKNARHGL